MIVQRHLDVALSMNFFYVNVNIFFHIRSNKINFVSAQYCTSKSLKRTMAGLDIVINKYIGRSIASSAIMQIINLTKPPSKTFSPDPPTHVRRT